MTATRSPEAARLEADYLARAGAALRGHADAAGILEGLREHIDAAVAEQPGPVGLARMAEILERLGPPQAVAPSPPASSAGEPGAMTGRPDDGAADAGYLDRLWLALLFGVVAIYIPVIDFFVFEIVSLVLLALACRAAPPCIAGFRRSEPLAWCALITCVMITPLTLVNMKSPLAGLVLLPTWILFYIFHLILIWQTLGAASALVAGVGQGLAERLLRARVRYIIVFSAAATIVLLGGLFMPPRRGLLEILVLDLLLMPVGWIIGWLFILRPLKPAREAMHNRVGGPVASLEARPI